MNEPNFNFFESVYDSSFLKFYIFRYFSKINAINHLIINFIIDIFGEKLKIIFILKSNDQRIGI
jgi:hypothetical protein